MNPLFADWHRDTSVDLAGIDLRAREAAADGVARDADGADVLRLVALAFGQPHHDAEGWLRLVFKEAEPAFPMKNNSAEIRMLAGAVLEQVCRAGALRMLAGQAVAVARHRGWDCPLPEVLQAADHTLAELAVTARRRPRMPVADIPDALTEQLEEAAEALAAAGSAALAQAVGSALRKAAEGATASAAAAAAHADAVLLWADSRARLADEETGLLWWLLSGHSSTLGEPWSALPPAVLAVAAGRELAAASAVLPAPPQADALLAQLVAVNARPRKPLSGAVPAPLNAPPELAFLVARDLLLDAPAGDPLALARHSLDQAVLVRVWEEFE